MLFTTETHSVARAMGLAGAGALLSVAAGGFCVTPAQAAEASQAAQTAQPIQSAQASQTLQLAQTTQASQTAQTGQTVQVKAGSGQSRGVYRISGNHATYVKPLAKGETVAVAAFVEANGKTYPVTGVAKRAFKNSKAKTVFLLGKKLAASSVKASLKGSKVAKVRAPYSVAKKYKTMFAKKNSGKTVKVYMNYRTKYFSINFPSRWVGKVHLKKDSECGNLLYRWYYNTHSYKNTPEIQVLLSPLGGDAEMVCKTKYFRSSYYKYAAVAYMPSWKQMDPGMIRDLKLKKSTWRHGAKDADVNYIVKSAKFY